MTRIKISCGILLLIIIMGISGYFLLKHEVNEVIDNIDKTQALSDEGRIDEALAAADLLLKDWDKFHTYASVFVNNNKISPAQISISRIKPLIESGNDELSAEYETARSALKWIIESEIPRLTNIL